MNKKGLIGMIIIVGILLVGGFFWFVGERININDEVDEIANPASVYCIRQGFVLDVRDKENGSVSYCVADDGQECEEWKFFHGECSFDDYELCVKDSCCHASDCVWESETPDCSNFMCTMECVDGTMDCGAGYCEVVNGECEVVWDEME